jgi:hypothetical protein
MYQKYLIALALQIYLHDVYQLIAIKT